MFVRRDSFAICSSAASITAPAGTGCLRRVQAARDGIASTRSRKTPSARARELATACTCRRRHRRRWIRSPFAREPRRSRSWYQRPPTRRRTLREIARLQSLGSCRSGYRVCLCFVVRVHLLVGANRCELFARRPTHVIERLAVDCKHVVRIRHVLEKLPRQEVQKQVRPPTRKTVRVLANVDDDSGATKKL